MSKAPEKPPLEENTEKTQAPPPSSAMPAAIETKSNKLMLFGFIGVTCILMLTLGALATLLLKKDGQDNVVHHDTKKSKSVKKEELKKEEPKKEEPKKEESKAESTDGEKKESGEEGAASNTPEFYQVRPSIVITLPASGRTRYVSLDIDLMTRSKSSIKTLEVYAPLIKSNLIELLGKQSFDQMVTEEGKANLRAKALEILQKLMSEQSGEPIIEQVLFTSFIVQ